MSKDGETFEKLVAILATLRGPNGCPWDKEQTYQDINPYLLEETHEVLESIGQKDFTGLKEELGDLLVHILFYCQLAREEKRFDAAQVIQSACEKLIRRHPHVFGDAKATTTQEVLANWEKIKQKENKQKRDSILEGLPKTLSALIQAFRIGEKASRVGFDWKNIEGILEKVDEELKELKDALHTDFANAVRNTHDAEREYGDLLFTLANIGRFLKVDPETALRKSIGRFVTRFQWIEKKFKELGRPLQDLDSQEWDSLWKEAKNSQRPFSKGGHSPHPGSN